MFYSGERIGPYVLVRELGRGNFGVVWLAEKPTSLATHQVALKLPLEIDADPGAIVKEAQVWVQASGHANVLPVIEAEVYDGRMVIVSEYAEGGSLREWLKHHRDRPVHLDKILELALGILSGLNHLHSKHIAHRDLKPSNILLQAGIPRLSDFGLARVLRSSGHFSTIAGTPAYMAPETWEGQGSEQSDLWSVGVVLYEMLAGRHPYIETQLLPLFKAISTRKPDPLPTRVPSALAELILRALEKDLPRRYHTVQEMLADLLLCKKGTPARKKPSVSQPSGENYLDYLWNFLEPDFQDALSLAFNQAKRAGKSKISADLFFAAMQRLTGDKPAQEKPAKEDIYQSLESSPVHR